MGVWMRLRARVREATGSTRHYHAHLSGSGIVKDEQLPVPASVEIEAVDGAFYLLYMDARGQCQTDTWHETLDQAKAQAEHEFGIGAGDWVEVK
jgi:hypothetical protein